VTKVLLQMKHGQLAPSLHAETLNPHIDFENSPFVVQRELAEWKRPMVSVDGEAIEYPRIAGVSSFGAGGSNAHLVIEEYRPERPAASAMVTPQAPAILVLSARTEEQLRLQVRRLLEIVQSGTITDANLTDVAYTLQVGREAMEHRLALTAESATQLAEKLTRLVGGQQVDELYRGEVKRNKEALAVFSVDEELREAIDKWIERGKFGRLLDLWVKGLVIDWERLHGGIKPRRISLPTYPFARERYWIPKAMEALKASQQKGAVLPAAAAVVPSGDARFDERFYDQLFEAVLTGTATVDAAAARTRARMDEELSSVERI
jgi:acyl transferase domain-containing protein